MGKSIFIDTSEKLVLGLLDDQYNWIDYLNTNEKKGSAILHGLLFELLKNNKSHINEIGHFFLMAGPGSYTGMRLGEGIIQIMEAFGKKAFSLYHFDIPLLLGISKGIWASKAFKKEIFIFEWDGLKNSSKLISEEDFELYKIKNKSLNIPMYTHFEDESFEGFLLTSELMNVHANEIFYDMSTHQKRKQPYYYRPLEKEFRPTVFS